MFPSCKNEYFRHDYLKSFITLITEVHFKQVQNCSFNISTKFHFDLTWSYMPFGLKCLCNILSMEDHITEHIC